MIKQLSAKIEDLERRVARLENATKDETCNVGGCKGNVVPMISDDGFAWLGECCDTCPAAWFDKTPKNTGDIPEHSQHLARTRVKNV